MAMLIFLEPVEPMPRVFLTEKGVEKLKADIMTLQHELKHKIAPEIARARELGDLRENAEYESIKRHQEDVNRRLTELSEKLAHAEIIRAGDMNPDTVTVGKRVTFRDMDTDEVETYIILGDGESNADEGIISYQSPLAKGLIGHRIGEEVAVPLPRTTLRIKIESIELFNGA